MAYKDSLLITSLCDKTKVEENYVHTIVIIRFKKTKSSKKRFKKTKKQKRKGKPTGGSTVIYIYIYIVNHGKEMWGIYSSPQQYKLIQICFQIFWWSECKEGVLSMKKMEKKRCVQMRRKNKLKRRKKKEEDQLLFLSILCIVHIQVKHNIDETYF